MKISSTSPDCTIHVSRINKRIRISKQTPHGPYVMNLNRDDARAIVDAVHDLLEEDL